MATYKQISFIEKLMSEKNIDSSTYNSVEAQTIRIGRGEELSNNQASNFIELLLSLDNKERKIVELSHEEFEAKKNERTGYRRPTKAEKAAHDAKVQARLDLIAKNRAVNA